MIDQNKQISQIAVIGSGTMGNGIAHVCGLSGRKVHLMDSDSNRLELGKQTIGNNLDRMIKKGIIDDTQREQTLNNIELFTQLDEAIQSCDLIIEAIPEKLELKEQLWKNIDVHIQKVSETDYPILATNTSSISITKLAEVVSRPEMMIGMHFFNPVPVMPLVEIILSKLTNQTAYNRIHELTLSFNKTPIKVQDRPGFVSNRILMPMINEAIYALYEEVADAESIDQVMTLGMAHPMGPLRLADFIGLDVCLNIMQVLYDGFGDKKYLPCPLLVEKVQKGELGNKTSKGFFNYTTSS
jgi:3-hydroxybutyryl-CoA dehydrogenase